MSPPANTGPIRDIPPEAISRLLQHLGNLLHGVHEGLQSAAADPAQHARWTRAASLLQRDLNVAQLAAHHAAEGAWQPLIAHASQLRFLARRMDGYRLDFAGAALATRLETHRRLTVLVSWQIYATANGSKATGL